MTVSVWILGDQLLQTHPALQKAKGMVGQDEVRVVLVEAEIANGRLPYQRKKLVLLLSAMRHYADQLREAGYTVDYQQSATFTAGLKAHLQAHPAEQLLCMAASGWNGRQYQQTLEERLGLPVELLPNTQFLLGQHNPIPDPEPDKFYMMEHFYRDMRRHFGVLMQEDGEPVGDAWNFDQENRKKLPKDDTPPEDVTVAPDKITQGVMGKVTQMTHAVGEVSGFAYAVTHEQAWQLFERFLDERLTKFGPYEDAMTSRSHSLYHAVLSPYLNLGLLEPLSLIREVEKRYHEGQAPLNSVEGFIRQVLGWREFMYWQYWRQMPEMKQKNGWGAKRPLPDFFWTGDTKMACMAHALHRAIDTGYNHHIERLMLLGNYGLLAGIEPSVLNDWFSAMYIDAYDWVMPPNVIGMSLNADGGLTATKPYFSSANYIHKMGDFCQGCHYDHKKRHGEDACPFNFLYWNFILEHQEALEANNRTRRQVWGLRHLDEAEQTAVQNQAKQYLAETSPP